MKRLSCAVLVSVSVLMGTPGAAQEQTSPSHLKYSANVPAEILTPDTVQTRIGTLKFFDGLPDEATVQKVYDQLDFGRGVEAFMTGMPAASVYALCEGLSSVGAARNGAIAMTEGLMDARSIFLTPNSTTVYVMLCLDLNKGPMVVQVPPNVLGPVDDAYFRWVTDVGLTGPDKGQGGKYLFVPPGHEKSVPESGYFVSKPRTNAVLVFYRAFVQKGDIASAVKAVKENARVYPLDMAANPPVQKFLDISGKQFNTVHANTFHFYEELDAVVQNEPAGFAGPEATGLFASIGIKKGEAFAPDARMKATLTDAVAVANATARAIVFAPRDPRVKIYADRQWGTGFVGGSYQFMDDGARMLDARSLFHYYATGITPAMAAARPGSGSAYAYAARDAHGTYLDGGKTYKITLPAPVPVKDFWSFTVYDNQTRSMLETHQKLAGIDSNQPSIKPNADGSVTIWFGPEAPSGQDGNWVETTPGKGWNVLLRLYGPLQPWFDKTWKPGDFEVVG